MLIKILNEELTSQIKSLFEAQLAHPVHLLYFFEAENCDTCTETGQLLEEIAALSKNVHLDKYEIAKNQLIDQRFNVHLTPSLVIAGDGVDGPTDHGIRFSGTPSGYEFGSLIQAIVMVSRRDSGLKPAVRSQLKDLKAPISLQVFVTPT